MFHFICRGLAPLAPGFLFLLTANIAWAAATGEDFSRLSSVLDEVLFEDGDVQSYSAHGAGSVDSDSARGGDNKLLGLFVKSDYNYGSFISPMTNPVFFEDPRTLTEARTIFLRQKIPTAAGGGAVQLIAVQFRAALTDRLSIVAAKDGFIMSDNALVNDGWADVSAGLKYNLYADPHTQRLLSAGFSYEMPVGTRRALQGNGDGEFHIYLTGGTQIGNYCHWLSASGFRLPSDPAAESRMWYWSNHFDYEFRKGWYALTEVNWYSWIGSGQNAALAGVEGGDLFNFGSTGVSGNNIVTQAVGLKYKRDRNREIGIAYEFPVTDRRDVMENRITVDWIFRY